MRDVLFIFWGLAPIGREGLILARFARLSSSRQVGWSSVGTAADLPTKAHRLANGTCRLVINREIQPTHNSTILISVYQGSSFD